MPDVQPLTQFPPVPPRAPEQGMLPPVGFERQPVRRQPDERLARRELRAQIARLERDLAETLVSAFPRGGVDSSPPSAPRRSGPRLLTLGELEATRDALATRLARARRQLSEQAEREERSRVLLERMLLEPGRYKFVRIPCADLGQRGCGEWHVRPRFGLIGMLAGWWQVKLSSGCPLAEGLPGPGSPAPRAGWPETVGRRSRKRGLADAPLAPSEGAGSTPPDARAAPIRRALPPNARRRPRREEAPPAPWAPFPLVELCILIGIVLMVVGAVNGGSRGALIIATGVALVSLSALEVSIREHFAGYKSHTSLLALACTVAVETLTYFIAHPAPILMAAVAVVAFGTAWTLLREAFRRRTGGLSWRA